MAACSWTLGKRERKPACRASRVGVGWWGVRDFLKGVPPRTDHPPCGGQSCQNKTSPAPRGGPGAVTGPGRVLCHLVGRNLAPGRPGPAEDALAGQDLLCTVGGAGSVKCCRSPLVAPRGDQGRCSGAWGGPVSPDRDAGRQGGAAEVPLRAGVSRGAFPATFTA